MTKFLLSNMTRVYLITPHFVRRGQKGKKKISKNVKKTLHKRSKVIFLSLSFLAIKVFYKGKTARLQVNLFEQRKNIEQKVLRLVSMK